MKIMICGKGGAGKTVITVLLGRSLSKYLKVYIVDSDESNLLLPTFLGVKPPKPLVELVGGKKDEEEFEKMEPDIAKALATARKGVRIDKLPKDYVSFTSEGIGLLTMGKVREYGEGCACPFSILTKIFLSNLKLEEDEVVLVDTDAGVEHIGRKIEEVCDGLLIVVDPSLESLEIASLLKDVALALNKKFWILANKVTSQIEELLLEEVAQLNLKIDGIVRLDNDLFLSTLKRETLKAKIALQDIEKITCKILSS